MKTLVIALAALTALSATSLANDRTEDFNAAYRNVHFGSANSYSPVKSRVTDSQALEVTGDYRDTTNFAIIKLRGIEVDNGRD